MSLTNSVPIERKLVGYDNFKRNNPKSDKFEILCFHHVEFYCSDSTNVSRRFSYALGMPIVAISNLSAGNSKYSSSILQSNSLCFVFTAPYGISFSKGKEEMSPPPHPGFDVEQAHNFVRGKFPRQNFSILYLLQSFTSSFQFFLTDHGLAVRAIAIKVTDASEAYRISTENGAVGVLKPTCLLDKVSGEMMVISEIRMFGDVVIRWVSGTFLGPMLPNYQPTDISHLGTTSSSTFGILRLDHSVSNVPKLFEAVDYLAAATGMHEFAEFASADIGTLDSGLNSMVLGNNNEMVLLPINEPTFGTKRQSQIQTYLDHNNGAGLQHLALLSEDIFETVRQMKVRGDPHSPTGGGAGFEFMPAPSADYYAKAVQRIGENVLSRSQWKDLQDLGILADKDDQVRYYAE
jgi:4-hydroxyphenylpyruvate dioxygenase